MANFANRGNSTLASSISAVATSLAVQSGHGARFPGAPFRAMLTDGALLEIIEVGTKTGDSFSNITRAVEDGSRFPAGEWAAGTAIEAAVTAASMVQAVAGNLNGAWVVASDAPAEMRSRAAFAKPFWGDFVQSCDGTADEVEINAALAIANSVRLSQGTFATAATITLPTPIDFGGAGKDGATVIVYSGSARAMEFANRVSDETQRRGVYLHDFEVRGASATEIINVKGMTRGTISRVDVHGTKEDAESAAAGSKGIVFDASYGGEVGSWWNRVDMCYITGLDTGIYLIGVQGAGRANENYVNQCLFKYIRAGGRAIHCEQGDKLTVQDCDITLTSALSVGIWNDQSVARIFNNRFEQTDRPVVLRGGNRSFVQYNHFSDSTATEVGTAAIDLTGSNHVVGPNTFGAGINKYIDNSTSNDASLSVLGRGLTPVIFAREALTPSMNNVQLTVAGTSSIHYLTRRPYTLRGVSFRLSGTPGSGTITIKPTIGGTAQTMEIGPTTQPAGSAWQGLGVVENSGTSSMGIRVLTTSDFPDGTLNIIIFLWYEELDNLAS